MYKVSVIVPVYNVEEYIRECILSIQNQTLRDIEIIIVNDGTPDKSMEVINDLVSKDDRIKVINKTNGGLSSARNAGISIAKGEYVSFIDSDDVVKPHFLERLYLSAKENTADVVRGSFSTLDGRRAYNWVTDASEGVTDGRGFMLMFTKERFALAVWSAIYKRELLLKNMIFFIEGVLFEDNPFWYEIASHAKRIMCVNSDDYLYRIRENSILTGTGIQKSIDSRRKIAKFILSKHRIDYKQNKQKDSALGYGLFDALYNLSGLCYRSKGTLTKKEVMEYIKIYFKMLRSLKLPVKIRIWNDIKWSILLVNSIRQ